jgi:hypothetical protein
MIKRMKKYIWISISIIFIALSCMLVNTFIIPIPDWLITTAGIITLVTYGVVTLIKNKYFTPKVTKRRASVRRANYVHMRREGQRFAELTWSACIARFSIYSENNIYRRKDL